MIGADDLIPFIADGGGAIGHDTAAGSAGNAGHFENVTKRETTMAAKPKHGLDKALKSAKEGLRLANKIIERARRDAAELARRHPHVRPILFPKEGNHGASK